MEYKLILGDIKRDTTDNSVDCVFVDLPYFGAVWVLVRLAWHVKN